MRNVSRNALAVLALTLALTPLAARAEDQGARVVVQRDRESALSDLLVAADGKLACRVSIPALEASVLVGKGAWGSLDARELAKAIRALALENKIALGYVEIDAVSKAAGECCAVDKPGKDTPDPDAEVKARKALTWPRRALGLEGKDVSAHGTIVAVLDTGVDAKHAALTDTILDAESLLDDDRDPGDRNGHGTAMIGAIVAHGQEGAISPEGIAPGARILSIKVMDEVGSGDVATLARGIVRAADRRARVILVSAGVAAPSHLLLDAVTYARSQGAIVIAASGNEVLSRALYPARTPGVVGVTASRPDHLLVLSCAVDPTIEIAAPGQDVLTTLPTALGGKGVLNGTSLSAALAAGVAALEFGTGASTDEVLRALRGARHPIPAFAGLERFMPVGELDAALALARLTRTGRALDAVWTLPSVARRGASLKVRALVRATGGKLAGGTLTINMGETRTTVALPALPADGSPVLVEANVTVPAELTAEVVTIGASLSPDDDETNDARTLTVSVLPKSAPQVSKLAIVDMTADEERGEIRVSVENQGETTESSPQVGVTQDGDSLRLRRSAATLAPGVSATFAFALAGNSREEAHFTATVRGASRAVQGDLDARLAGKDPRPVKPQYQQSNNVDIIADAPWRLEPNRDYVPVLIFAPSKGDAGKGLSLVIQKTTITAFDDASLTQNPTTLYRYDLGTPVASDPTRFAPGMSIQDENATRLTSLNLFDDQTLTENCRHQVLSFPRAAFGVAAQPTSPRDKFLDVKIHFEAQRSYFFGITTAQAGDYHKVLDVLFAAKPLPVLPGMGRYFDTHVHTIAEYYVSSRFDLLAPKKAYGGPIVMIREAAYAIGLTDKLVPAPGSIITTDHSCFFNTEDPESDTATRRPQVGPTAPQNSKNAQGQIADQLTRYREIFGMTSNEEVAFDETHKIWILGLPLGSHMLSFRTDHWEERWNGRDGGGSPNRRAFGNGALELTEILSTAATAAPARNQDAFFYSAHAFSNAQGWDTAHFDEGLELTPNANGTRSGKYFNTTTDNFVMKGHQLWNGRHGRSLPTSKIDWSDLNPFTDASWTKGYSNVARTVEEGLREYQKQVSTLMAYQRASQPGRVFPRKLYIAAGSDAHGDFNYSEDRQATFVPLQATFSVTDNAFGKARTFVFEDGIPGAQAERGMNALARGSSVVTDGPLARIAFDADGHFDSKNLVYHAGAAKFEDEDGQIGGGGNGPDGARTALVVAGSQDARWRYRYENAPEAPVSLLELYRIEAGVSPPVRRITDPSGASYDTPAPAATLPLGSPTVDNDAPAPFSFTNLTAVQLGAFAGGDPSKGDAPVTAHRCYANPIWIAPVKTEFVSKSYDLAAGKFLVGSLRVRFTFPMSMNPLALAIDVKPLDAQGNTTAGSVAGARLTGTWSDDPTTGTRNAVLEVTNADEISLAQFDYPRPNTATFVVYFRDAPQDSFGNALNPIARTFDAPRVGKPQVTGNGSTASGSQVPSGFLGNHGGGGGGGGCALEGSSADPRGFLPFALLALVLVVRRRR